MCRQPNGEKMCEGVGKPAKFKKWCVKDHVCNDGKKGRNVGARCKAELPERNKATAPRMLPSLPDGMIGRLTSGVM